MNFKNAILIFFVSLTSAFSTFAQDDCSAEQIFNSYTGECPDVNQNSQCVSLDASESIDLNGVPMTFTWRFGDGKVGKGTKVSHCYAKPGTYQAVMIATAKGKGAKLKDEYPVEIIIDNMVTIEKVKVTESSRGFPYYFNGTKSFIEQGATITAYYWDFGDSTFSCGATVFHKFKEKGNYSIRLIVEANSKDNQVFQICGVMEFVVE